MSITCPVCDRSPVTEMICPNCGTDLSSYQMLVNLPVQEETTPNQRFFLLWLFVAILLVLLGLGLGLIGKSIVARQIIENSQSDNKVISSIETTTASELISMIAINQQNNNSSSNYFSTCSGFKYVVRSGDSLSLVASRFYGDFNYLSLIGNANLQLQGRESDIKIGEHIFIPNLDC